MNLSEIIAGLPIQIRQANRLLDDGDIDIIELCDDSRKACEDCLFVARQGADGGPGGIAYIDDVVQAGAAAILVSQGVEVEVPPEVVVLEAEGTADQTLLSHLASAFYGHPLQHLGVLAVTGTNGKTTVATLAHQLLTMRGIRCGLIGTVSVDCGEGESPATLTTPGALELMAMFREMVGNGCQLCVMEVSSHALDQGRVAAVPFMAAAFTNLTGDHLDYHGTMDAYCTAKAQLFTQLIDDGVAILNGDDDCAEVMAAQCPEGVEKWVVSADKDVGWQGKMEGISEHGMQVCLQGPWGDIDESLDTPEISEMCAEVSLFGVHNLTNLHQAVLLTQAVAPASVERLAQELPKLCAAPGRLERVLPCWPKVQDITGLPLVLVDYAHTHDALMRVLQTVAPLALLRQGKLIVVFGCGGDRDRTKRPKMAEVACAESDQVWVTSDNPRTEDPHAIIADVMQGAPQDACIQSVPVRAQAIQQAVAQASPQDIVLIAGKGHEDYQIVGTTRYNFDDRKHAARALATLWAKSFWTPRGVQHVLQAKWLREPDNQNIALTGLVHDSRQAKPNTVFAAVTGERTDGHRYLTQVLEQQGNGQGLLLVDEARCELDSLPENGTGILAVADVVEALQQLASAWRDVLAASGNRVIAVCGSNGKTSTRDLLYQTLTHCGLQGTQSPASFNNHLGVPLTLLAADAQDAFVAAEIGTNHPGEIDALGAIVRPDAVVITSIGEEHMEFFGDLHAVAREEGSIVDHLKIEGPLFVSQQASDWIMPYASLPKDCQWSVSDPDEFPLPEKLPIPGEHGQSNAALVFDVARWMGAKDELITQGLANATSVPGRWQCEQIGTTEVIHDAYNANPSSMRLALNELEKLAAKSNGPVWAVLGDMFELGDHGTQAHLDIVQRVMDLRASGRIQGVALLGKLMLQASTNSSLKPDMSAAEIDDAFATELIARMQDAELVLLKASRGMQLESILNKWSKQVSNEEES